MSSCSAWAKFDNSTKIKKWVALLLTVSGLAAAPLSVSAANRVIDTSGTTFDTGGAYTSITGTAALTITGSEVTYSGGNISININISDGFIGSTGIYASDHANLILHSSTITLLGNSAYGILFRGDRATVSHVTISSTRAYARGIQVENRGYIEIDNADVSSTGLRGYGVAVNSSGTMIIRDSNITSQDRTMIIHNTGNDSALIVATNVNLHSLIRGAVNILYGGEIILNHVNVTVDSPTEAMLFINGNNSPAYLEVNGGTLSTNGGNLLSVGGTNDVNVSFDNADISGAGAISKNSSGTATVNISGGSGIHGDVTNSDSGALNVNLNNTTLTGDVTGSGSSTLNINASNSV
ncbi:MAG: hypothetical protein LBD30_01445, partial [Verrucomicrobiales bacterium]|nr:hypothetical protein [Verrucomicrobiales bacterium]